MTNAAGIAGSFASGLLECWVDGTQSKFLHPGWAAQSGITAATLARAGATGPGDDPGRALRTLRFPSPGQPR